MNRTQRRPGLVVTTGGRGVVAHAGARLLCDTVDRLGPSAAAARRRAWATGMDPRFYVILFGCGSSGVTLLN